MVPSFETETQDHIFRSIVDKITKLSTPCIIGINGYDGAGKTYFTENFYKWLIYHGYKVAILQIDDFHNNLKTRRTGETEVQAYIDNAFNLSLVEELLKEIKSGQVIDQSYQLLDLETDTYTVDRYYKITPDMIILFEGVLLYREPIDQYIDFRIYLDVSIDNIIDRAVLRSPDRAPEETIKRYKSKYLKVQEWYHSVHKPKRKANLIIDNNNFKNPRFSKID